MNCFEKLWDHVKGVCEPCIKNAKIMEFEELPDHLKPSVDYYCRYPFSQTGLGQNYFSL
jgi:hypothetical protein